MMKCRTARSGSSLAVAIAVVLSACAADTLEHPSYWWNATVVSVARASEVPSGVNLACVPPHDDAAQVMVVQYRVGKAPVTKAYVDPNGARWFAGERVLVHPDTCRIKPAPARAS